MMCSDNDNGQCEECEDKYEISGDASKCNAEKATSNRRAVIG